jgi:hypothetical protein
MPLLEGEYEQIGKVLHFGSFSYVRQISLVLYRGKTTRRIKLEYPQ